MREEADALGITFGIKQAAMVEKANDAWARIGSIWKGLTQQLAINFAPMLELIARRIKDFVINAGGIGQVADIVVLSIAKMGAAAWNTMNSVQSGWLKFKSAVISGAGMWLEGFSLIFKDDTAMLMADALFKEAAQLYLDSEQFVPLVDIEKKLKELRKKLEGMGISDNMELNIVDLPDLAANFKGAAENLSTAIGSMKVEGDSQSRILSQTLNIEKEHLQTSKDTLDAIRSGGVVLT
jgi:hypothetical protein